MKRLLLTTAIALTLLSLIAGSVEVYWRQRGYTPGIIDSTDLWAQQRDRLRHSDKRPLALLGASRTVYNIDLPTLRQRLPDYQPVMLAIDANPAIATLRDLAHDRQFDGVVLCDIDGLGLWRVAWELQQPYVLHYHRQWTISRDLHRRLLSFWQRHAVIARSDFSLVRSLVRQWNGEPEPFHPYLWLDELRAGFIDFSRTDPTAHRRELEAHLAQYHGQLPHAPVEAWRADLAQVKTWVSAIQQRGGNVIFYATPISGLRHQVEEQTYPRALYWDQLGPATGAPTLHADDVPGLRDFPLADESHIDYHDKVRYTNLLIDALSERGWLPPRS